MNRARPPSRRRFQLAKKEVAWQKEVKQATPDQKKTVLMPKEGQWKTFGISTHLFNPTER
jgi:hypothetical protein